MLTLAAFAAAAGCTTGHEGDAVPVSQHPVVPARSAGCLADWNGASNRSAREETVPPAGPYPLYGGRRRASPAGRYQIFVARSVVIGAVGTNPPPVCYIYFRFPHGYNGRPAMVSYPEIDPEAGVYGDPSITIGNDTDVGGRVFAERPDGTLYPAPYSSINSGPKL
jgi:hypothetical protein